MRRWAARMWFRSASLCRRRTTRPGRLEEGLRFTPRYVDADPCVYGDQALGCLTRIASTALLNVSAGGGSAPPTYLVRSIDRPPSES